MKVAEWAGAFVAVVGALAPGWVHAEAPPVFGDGADGPLEVDGTTVSLSEYISPGRAYPDGVSYRVTEDLEAGATSIPLAQYAEGAIEGGAEVLIIAVQGTHADYETAGIHELHTVASDSPAGITLETGLGQAFPGSSYQVFVLRIPHYTTVTVRNGGTLTAAAWTARWNPTILYTSCPMWGT